jgi:hypothetical protein
LGGKVAREDKDSLRPGMKTRIVRCEVALYDF